MTRLGKRFLAVVLTAVICAMSGSVVYADEKEEKGFLETAGEWFVACGSDIQNAATLAVDTTGQWFIDRGEAICGVSTIVGNWTCDRANEVAVFVTDTGEAIVCAASNFDPSVLTTADYYQDSFESLLLGDFSDKDPTALTMALNLAASVANVDLGLDIVDLVYNIQHYGNGDVGIPDLALSAVAVLPVIGVVKYVKYADTVIDGVKIAGTVADTASDVAKSVDTAIDVADNVHDAAKIVDIADAAVDTTKAADALDDVVDTAKLADASKTVDLVDDAVDAGKDFTKIPFDELPEKAQETYKTYAECGWDGEKALESMTEGTSAGRPFKNREELLPIFDGTGNELTYHEFDAFSLGDDPEFDPENPHLRGLCRFVRDNLGNTYFTDDHYSTFTLITEAIAG